MNDEQLIEVIKDALNKVPNNVSGDGKTFVAALKRALSTYANGTTDAINSLLDQPAQVQDLTITEENLVVDNQQVNNITVSWDFSSVGDDYAGAQVWVKESSGEYELNGTAKGDKYVHSGAVTGTTYTYKVVAVNAKGNGADFITAPTTEHTVRGANRVPAAPTQFALTWDKEGPLWEWLYEDNGYVDYFELRLDGNAGEYSDKLLERTRNTTSRVNPNVRSGTAYLFIRNIFGVYSNAAIHGFAKPQGNKPEPPTIVRGLLGVQIQMDDLPIGFKGYRLILDETDEYIVSESVFTLYRMSGTVSARYCFIDDIGDGEFSDTVTADIMINIDSDHLADNAVVSEKIVANAVVADKISAGAITADKIQAGAITAGKLAADSVATENLQAGSIIGEKISASAIGTRELAADAVTATQIKSSAITSDKIAANAVTADKMDVGSLSAISAIIGTLRTSTSGARLEIKDNLIAVYYSNGSPAVYIGVW